MASTIKLKNGSGAPTSGQLVQGEPALDLTNKRLYTENASGTVIEVGINPSSLTTASADINGGTIDGTVIGATTPAAGSFTTISASGEIAANGGVAFGDNDKATFGASDDLQIYHDGSNTRITEAGTGSLLISADDLFLRNVAGNSYFQGISGGSSNIFHAGSVKLATTATGIDVTGTVTADGLTVDGVIGNMATFNGTLGDVIISADGASVSFTRPSTTYLRASDVVGNLSIQTGGSINRALFSNNGDISFYEDTGTTAKFFWDASTEALGIGTSSIAAGTKLQVAGETRIYPDSGTATLRLGSGGVEKGKFSVDTSSNMAFETAGTERARIDSSGNATFNTTDIAPAANNVLGTAILQYGGASMSRTNSITLDLNRSSSDGVILNFRKDGTAVGSIGSSAGDLIIGTGDAGLLFRDEFNAIQPHNISTNLATDATLTLGKLGARFKDLYLSGGVYFGGTGAANLLDDYEEGTWSPTYTAGIGSFTTLTLASATAGYYTKVGNVCTVWGLIRTDNVDTTGASGSLFLSGLPFAVSGFNGVMTPSLVTAFSDNGGVHSGYAHTGGTYINLRKRATSDGNTLTVSVADLSTGANTGHNYLIFAMTYKTTG